MGIRSQEHAFVPLLKPCIKLPVASVFFSPQVAGFCGFHSKWPSLLPTSTVLSQVSSQSVALHPVWSGIGGLFVHTMWGPSTSRIRSQPRDAFICVHYRFSYGQWVVFPNPQIAMFYVGKPPQGTGLYWILPDQQATFWGLPISSFWGLLLIAHNLLPSTSGGCVTCYNALCVFYYNKSILNHNSPSNVVFDIPVWHNKESR